MTTCEGIKMDQPVCKTHVETTFSYTHVHTGVSDDLGHPDTLEGRPGCEDGLIMMERVEQFEFWVRHDSSL